MWAGGHDIGNYLEYGLPDIKINPPALNYELAIEKLIKAGAKNIFVGNMPDMGYSPGYFGTDKQNSASQLCKELNEGLYKIKQKYENTNVKFYLFDGARVFSSIAMSPESYGIKYLDAYLPMNVINFMNPLEKTNVEISNKEKGLDPDLFMNWWAVSASRIVHQILAKEAYNFIINN